MNCAKQIRVAPAREPMPPQSLRIWRKLKLSDLASIAAAADCVLRSRHGQLVIESR